MCGICGVLSHKGKPADLPSLKKALAALRHRGPDDEGYLLVDVNPGCHISCRGKDTVGFSNLPAVEEHFSGHFDLALGHRRLSIIDLSPAGHQPLSNEDGTIWAVYNGEIYNYPDVRAELTCRGHVFRSNTDTEVIVHAYEEWGCDCIHKFNGMWVFALWDKRNKKLFCSRDRFGIKPFYYFSGEEGFIFASEIKALLEISPAGRKKNDRAIFDYLARGLVDHGGETFFSGIQKLKAGHNLILQFPDFKPYIYSYYSISPVNKITGLDGGEYAERFFELFRDSVKKRLISDVPVGSCLSGGLDSSSVVCMINKLMKDTGLMLPGDQGILKTFSARYQGGRHDEGIFIEEVIKKTGAGARFVYPTGENLREDLEELVWRQEEPFGSTSVYAQWEVFRLVGQSGVKVVLDGQGGDEILAGYHSYFPGLFSELLRTYQWRQFINEFLAYLDLPHKPRAGPALARILFNFLPERLAAGLLNAGKADCRWMNREFAASVVKDISESAVPASIKNLFDRELYRGLMFDGLPSYLRYEDKNSMAHSVEARLPFLDYRLVEFAFSLPWEQKLSGGTTKCVLRSALQKILPEAVKARRDKIGFSTPEDEWFRTTLKETAVEIIESESFRQRPFFDVCKVKGELTAHLQGKKNSSIHIWRWINLELWLRAFID